MFEWERCAAVVPCFQAEATIGPVVASLLRQTRPPDEILVIDDGSRDRSAAIVAQFPGVRLVRHPRNEGLSQARNTAIAEADADILLYVDSDAPADARLVERTLAWYGPDDVAGVGGRGVEVYRGSGADLWRGCHSLAQTHGASPVEAAPFLFGLCSSYRRDVLREVGGFDLGHRTNGEDVEIGLRLRERGYRLVFEPGAIVWHLRRDTPRSLVKMAYRYHYWACGAVLRHADQSRWFPVWEAARAGGYNLLKDTRWLGRPEQVALSLACLGATTLAGFRCWSRAATSAEVWSGL